MLRSLGVLPTEARARELKNRDILWCALQLMLDDEEAVSRLCPACRAEAERECCPVCGGWTGQSSGGENASFDWERFEELGKGGAL